MGSQKTIPVSAFYMFLYNWTLFKLENIKGGSDTGKITSHVHTPHFFRKYRKRRKNKEFTRFSSTLGKIEKIARVRDMQNFVQGGTPGLRRAHNSKQSRRKYLNSTPLSNNSKRLAES